MSYSPNLVYFMDRLSGFSTNIFKLMPQGSPKAEPNSITRITLPANALLNTRSFKLHFRATTTGTGARLPADLSTLVERIEVSAGGVQLSQGTQFYNTLCNAKAAIMGSKCDSVTGHSEVVRRNKFDGSSVALGAGANEIYSTGTPHVIDKWEGFLGTCEPKILDAAILPDLVVSIYWADNSVLASCRDTSTETAFTLAPAAGASAQYTIEEIHASIETIGLADSVYDNMVSSMIAQKGFVEIPFKQYFSFSDTHTGASRFTVATQSLDRIWTAWREDGYNNLGPPVAVPGYGFGDEEKSLAIPTNAITLLTGEITLANHGYVVGQALTYRSAGGNAAAPLVDGSVVYVKSKNVGDFIISVTPGGAAQPLTSAGNNAQYFQTNASPSDYRGVFGTSGDKYLTKFQRFKQPTAAVGGTLTYQFQLNGAYYPQYPAGTEDMYQITKNSLPGSVKYDLTKQQLTDSYFVQCIRLNMPDSEFSRTASGLDTRSVSLNGYVNTAGLASGSNPNLMIFAEVTSSLRVGSGRQLEVVI
jgi:hypothetical protein